MKSCFGLLGCVLALLLVPACRLSPVTPGEGDRAPSFQAALDTGEKTTFDSLMGEKGMVLYFYPKDETPGCIDQACTFQENLMEFQKAGYRVVGVSIDIGGSHKAFRSKYNLKFDLIGDNDKSIAKLYNVPTERDPKGTMGFKRTTFVITKDGIVRHRFEVSDPKEQVKLAAKAIEQPY